MSLVALAALLGMTGCASQALLAADFAALQQAVASAHERTNCAPQALALADVNLEFAKLEFDQGDTRRAAEHIAVAREQAKIAAACASPSAPAPIRAATPKAVVAAPVPQVAPTPTDRDGDGVTDADDICIHDPEDLDGFKDSDGCPDLDDDGDAVPDHVDRCPRDAEDRDGTDDADGCPDPDNDRDGLLDLSDPCPNEAGPPGGTGCPSRDRDNDGVGDSTDACPDQAETRNDYLDTDGCPDTKPQRVEVTADKIVIKQRINFTTGKATILSDSFPVLDDVALAMKDYPALKVEIGGHTDNMGDDAGNQRLSKARADAVFAYLAAHGVSGFRMIAVGYGETAPIDTNMTDGGRMVNRRVEFLIVK